MPGSARSASNGARTRAPHSKAPLPVIEFWMRVYPLLVLTVVVACTHHHEPAVRYLSRVESQPHAAAPGAQHRLLATRADGAKEYALVLARGDEVMSGLSEFARAEQVTAASFTAIGAVRDPEVGWFDFEKQRYKAMRRDGQFEVLSLVGDIGQNAEGAATVHAHASLGGESGRAFGGHLIAATVSPTLEVFVTTYGAPLNKRRDPSNDVELFQLSTP